MFLLTREYLIFTAILVIMLPVHAGATCVFLSLYTQRPFVHCVNEIARYLFVLFYIKKDE